MATPTHDHTTDPYAGGSRRVSASERRSEVDHFAARLRALGATDDEVASVVDNWDELDPDDAVAEPGDPEPFTRARRDYLVRAGDTELQQLIQASRDEYAYGTTTEADATEADAAVAAERAHQAHLADAARHIGGSVAEVLAWVGNDVGRARAALELETDADVGGNRKTLVAPLQELAGSTSTPQRDETTPGGTTTAHTAPAPAHGPQAPAGGAPGGSTSAE
jgi:hypothetical protein